ncbi:hypothetical protein PoB_003207200 [Plakobranchus ocellatus]|uniref:Uncharacterized protein n=1 Tax=Plakobranchus ocellatus TaxID=259542 RepID=A0AAV4AEZ6_9GAST|nr:hypothetical protein PoB_003207200 [Plakobranchus ocellatus]
MSTCDRVQDGRPAWLLIQQFFQDQEIEKESCSVRDCQACERAGVTDQSTKITAVRVERALVPAQPQFTGLQVTARVVLTFN